MQGKKRIKFNKCFYFHKNCLKAYKIHYLEAYILQVIGMPLYYLLD